MGEVVFFTHYNPGKIKFFTVSNDKYKLDKQLLEINCEVDRGFQHLEKWSKLGKQYIVSDSFVMKSKTELVGFYFDKEGNWRENLKKIKVEDNMEINNFYALITALEKGDDEEHSITAKLIEIFNLNPDIFNHKLLKGDAGLITILENVIKSGICDSHPIIAFYFDKLGSSKDAYYKEAFEEYFRKGEGTEYNKEIIKLAITNYMKTIFNENKLNFFINNIGCEPENGGFKEWTYAYFQPHIHECLGKFNFKESCLFESNHDKIKKFNTLLKKESKQFNELLKKESKKFINLKGSLDLFDIDMNDGVIDKETHYKEQFEFLSNEDKYEFLKIVIEKDNLENTKKLSTEIHKAYKLLKESLKSENIEVKRAAVKIETIGEMIRFYRILSKYKE